MNLKKTATMALALSVALLFANSAESRTLYVNAAAKNNKGSGLSVKKAKKTIQAAINIAKAGDTILVYPGTYAPIRANNKKIAIKSVNGKSKTVIRNKSDGDLAVALLGKPWSYDAYVDTMGVKQPKGDTAPYCEGKATTLAGFVLDGGYAGSVGVQFGVSGGKVKSSTIQGIGAKFGRNVFGGAAIDANLTSCLITGNRYIGSGSGLVVNCTVRQCKIVGNSGTGYSELASNSTLVNTLVAQNTIDDWGFYASTLVNCTIADNETQYVNFVPQFAYKSKFYNCILFNNRRGKAIFQDDGYVVGKTSVHNVDTAKSAGNTYKNTNKTNKNPKFANAAKKDYGLKKGSFCINLGKLSSAQKALVGTKDLAGKKRIKGGAIDLGCYEY